MTATNHQQTADLIGWLRAQIAADEDLARRVADRYRIRDGDRADAGQPYWPLPSVVANLRDRGRDPGITAGLDLIEACSPARVLAEVTAKRAVLDLRDAVAAAVEATEGTVLAGAARVRLGAYDNAARLLAVPYADRPGYRPEWRPR